MSKLNETKNSLPEGARVELVGLLNARLAETIDLELSAKQAHWNVKGPHFSQLHALFEDAYKEASGWGDLLAERAVALGGIAQGTIASVASKSGLSAFPDDAVGETPYLNAYTDALAAFSKRLREAIVTAERLDDAATADVFTEVVRASDKRLWMVEAHLARR